ncbi:methyltransferase domain-containing protein [Actinoplanes sp. NPDC089786]|uniref:methyltransferase domain-containing protein n=1 Tax=Actinoplanes sp. NPDC089786 TaxID=3155185 RepID=UPI0034203B81
MPTFSDKAQPQYLRDYLAIAAASPDIARVRATALDLWELGTGELRLLDAGSGNGEAARELAALLPGAEVTAVDFSADAVAEATRGHDGSRVKYEVGDVCDLPYENGQFDGVRSERVLQHLTDPDRAVAEMTRVLRPGGRLCLIDTDFESLLVDGSPAGFSDVVREAIKAVSALRAAEAMSSGRTLRRRMVRAGLTDLRAEPITVVHTDVAAASRLVPLQRTSAMAGALGERLDALFEVVEQAAADGTFLLVLTMWAVAGSKPR